MPKLTRGELAQIMRKAATGGLEPRMLRALAVDVEEGGLLEERIVVDPKTRITTLNELLKSLQDKAVFKVGDIVRWKPRLKNKRRPEYDEPVVVVEVLREPVVDAEGKDSSSCYFREPLNVALGLVDDDGELVVYHYDSRRFEIYTEK